MEPTITEKLEAANKPTLVQLFGPQWEAFNCPKRFVLCSAGIQGGKTFVGCVWMLQKIQQFPNDSHLICAPTYKILQQSTLPKFRELVPSSIATYHEQDQYFQINGASGKIYVRSGEDPDTLEGMTLRSAWLDEAGNIKRRVWVIIQGRTAILQGQVFMTTSPYTMNWVYHDIFKRGEDGHKDFGLFQWQSIDNPKFPREEYERAKTTMSETDFARRYKGLWRKREGLVYMDWNPITMTFVGSPPVPSKEVVAGVDWGYQHPAAIVVVGIGDKPSHVVLDEWYKTRQTIDLMVKAARELKERHGIKWFYADPARPEYIKAFNDNGLPTIAADNQVVAGINEVRLRIRTNNLMVASHCKNLMEEMDMYTYPEGQDGEEPEKQMDHCFTGDTLILTKSGLKRIDKIHGGEYVWSPFGWNKVYRAGSTGIKRIKDFGIFRCTPDHKILTSRGLVEVDKLRYSDTIMIWSNTKQLSLMTFLIEGIQTPKIELIGLIFNALLTKSLMAGRGFYTEMYGSSIKGKFLMAIWSIMLMVTLGIITLVILSLSSLVNIQKNIIGVFGMVWENILKLCGVKQKYGTNRQREKNGTLFMPKTLGKPTKYLLNRVYTVVPPMIPLSHLDPSSVIQTVKQKIFVEEEVFNLATKFGMYFANGVLVSNCQDALRYAVYSYKIAAPVFEDGLSPMWKTIKEEIKEQRHSQEMEDSGYGDGSGLGFDNLYGDEVM